MHLEEPSSALHTFLCACTHLKLVTQFLFVCAAMLLSPAELRLDSPVADVKTITFLETYLGLDNKT